MPAKGNQLVPNGHFHKEWQERVKTWFDQPGRKKRRRLARAAKAARVFPRPVDVLRPVVHAPTNRYNSKVRLGRGFTLEELKEAGVNRYLAKTIGIAVDHRRRNKSDKSLKVNAQRLKEYKSKLVLFPRNDKKPKAGEAKPDEKVQQQVGTVLPLKSKVNKQATVKISTIDTKTSAYAQLRKARTDARLVGVRAKRQKEKAEKAAAEAAKAK
eukprot:TRINITY_DN3170_c0_g1_i1.p1 TRINITY_DN3170_c0_g1~~TRINITY_DN3170_c0_g1_i1.p1  ORF type:complete len:212 (+),score=64.33 TRINITY_DN3170_c0_g1_i1:72-707(+)